MPFLTSILMLLLLFPSPLWASLWWMQYGCNDAGGGGAKSMRTDAFGSACLANPAFFNGAAWTIPFAGTIQYFSCMNHSASGTYIFTVQKNGESTVASCTVTPGQESCHWQRPDTVPMPTVVEGTRLSVETNDTEAIDGGVVECQIGVAIAP